ncbi:VOC family protein [Arenicella xantha]|uniref:Methylmalonyl-CoA epimerase n=1 Tax=Arenicella xantha TaxID=644221 RepID=A0A395JMH5_9GAMM|nr:VOC family protein [Arenicella xantha]RBP52830.1 methylmalonyl-CoA epimerase [Arenicella xantha]
MSEPISVSGVGQIARTVSDLAQSVAWYSDVLGLRHLYTFGNMAFFECGETRLMLTETEALAPESIVYFSSSDIVGDSNTLIARGVEFVQAPQLVHQHEDGSQEWMGFFNDPDGRPLGLMERRVGN